MGLLFTLWCLFGLLLSLIVSICLDSDGYEFTDIKIPKRILLFVLIGPVAFGVWAIFKGLKCFADWLTE